MYPCGKIPPVQTLPRGCPEYFSLTHWGLFLWTGVCVCGDHRAAGWERSWAVKPLAAPWEDCESFPRHASALSPPCQVLVPPVFEVSCTCRQQTTIVYIGQLVNWGWLVSRSRDPPFSLLSFQSDTCFVVCVWLAVVDKCSHHLTGENGGTCCALIFQSSNRDR